MVPKHSQVSGRSNVCDVTPQLELSVLHHCVGVVHMEDGDTVWCFWGDNLIGQEKDNEHNHIQAADTKSIN